MLPQNYSTNHLVREETDSTLLQRVKSWPGTLGARGTPPFFMSPENFYFLKSQSLSYLQLFFLHHFSKDQESNKESNYIIFNWKH